jgi:hypothetical protein
MEVADCSEAQATRCHISEESCVRPISLLLKNCAELKKYCFCMAVRRGVVSMAVRLVHPRPTGMKSSNEDVTLRLSVVCKVV